MKDVFKHFTVNGIEYPFCFNINVIEKIADEYKNIQKWAESLDSKEGSEQIKALKFMMCEAVNEGIDIENDEKHLTRDFINLKQAGRLVGGFSDAMQFTMSAIAESNDTAKNALTEQNQTETAQ